MPRSTVAIRDITYTHPAQPEPLFADLSAHFPCGFTGIVGANGAGKTTLLRLVVGELAPSGGKIDRTGDAVYCEQRTDDPPHDLSGFLEDWSSEAFEARRHFGIAEDYLDRWDSLSHGERKRAQIGHALWQAPEVLAIDEPTNHIDTRAREVLLAGLRRYRGVGLIVSHDRELLDELCVQCLWLEPPRVQVFTGGYTDAARQRQGERETALRERHHAVQETRRMQREIGRRRERAAAEHRVRSKRGLSRKDSDARRKIDLARVTDGKAGSSLRQLDGRFEQARARLDASRVDKRYETGIWLPGSRSRRDTLVNLDAGEIPLGGGRVLSVPDITIRPDDRIAITGENGAGKSTLIRHLLPLLNAPADKIIHMPQEISAAVAREVLDAARRRPHEELGHIMNVVSRLNSRPARLIDSHQPSPGEVRKLLLALGRSRAPHAIVMDEPTNHLDLPSIEALESALSECPCALLLVSHDRRFIEHVGATIWTVAMDARGNSSLLVD